jgi:hypothetical protein
MHRHAVEYSTYPRGPRSGPAGLPEYRAGYHELMSTVFVGEAHTPKGDPIICSPCANSCRVRRPPAPWRIPAAS